MLDWCCEVQRHKRTKAQARCQRIRPNPHEPLRQRFSNPVAVIKPVDYIVVKLRLLVFGANFRCRIVAVTVTTGDAVRQGRNLIAAIPGKL
jgi:hypothetical protein